MTAAIPTGASESEEINKEEFMEDIGRPEDKPEAVKPTVVHAAYVVVLNADGSLNTTAVKPGQPIAKTVLAQILPKDPEAEAKARIAQALAERKAE